MEKWTTGIGGRVKVKSRDVEGTIVFIGSTEFAPGIWYGVILDEPRGKNNGTVNNKKYFSCPEGHGLFVRKSNLEPIDDVQELCLLCEGHNKRTLLEMKLVAALMNQKLEALRWEKCSRELENENFVLQQKLKEAEECLHIHQSLTNKQSEVIDMAKKSLIRHEYFVGHVSRLKMQLNWSLSEEEIIRKEKTHCERELIELAKLAQLANNEKEAYASELSQKAVELENAENKIITLEKTLATISRESITGDVSNAIKDSSQVVEKNYDYALTTTHTKYPAISYSPWSESENSQINHNEETEALKETIAEQQDVIVSQQSVISELNETIDALAESEYLIEKLTEKNILLEKQNYKLQDELSQLEALQGAGNETERLLEEMEHEISEELRSSKAKISEMMNRLQKQTETLEFQNYIIMKFQKLVNDLEHTKCVLEARLVKQTNECSKSETYHSKNFLSKKERFQEQQRLGDLTSEVELSDTLLRYWSAFLPESFFSFSGEHEAILFIVHLKRILRKTNVLRYGIKTNFTKPKDELPKAILKSTEWEKYTFGRQLLFRVYIIEMHVRHLQEFMDGCSIYELLHAGTLYLDLKKKSEVLDKYVEIFNSFAIATESDMNDLDHFILYLNSILSQSEKSPKAYLEYHLKSIKVGAKLLYFDFHLILAMFSKRPDKEHTLDSWIIDNIRTLNDLNLRLKSMLLYAKLMKCFVTIEESAVNELNSIQSDLEKYICASRSAHQHINRCAAKPETCAAQLDESTIRLWNGCLENLPKKLHNIIVAINMDVYSDYKQTPFHLTSVHRRAMEIKQEQFDSSLTTNQRLNGAVKFLHSLKCLLKTESEKLSLIRVKHDSTKRELAAAVSEVNQMDLQLIHLRNCLESSVPQQQYEMLQWHIEDIKITYRALAHKNGSRIHSMNKRLSELPVLSVPRQLTLSIFQRNKSYALIGASHVLMYRALNLLLNPVMDISKPADHDEKYRKRLSMKFYEQRILQRDMEMLKQKINSYKSSLL